MPNENFFSNENIIAMMDGNIRAYKIMNSIPVEEKEIVYCSECGFPVGGNYEKEIKCHLDCKED